MSSGARPNQKNKLIKLIRIEKLIKKLFKLGIDSLRKNKSKLIKKKKKIIGERDNIQ